MAVLQEGRSLELTQELLKGAIDIHVHPGRHPKSSPRRLDLIEATDGSRRTSHLGARQKV
jgi:hypothetical protein